MAQPTQTEVIIADHALNHKDNPHVPVGINGPTIFSRESSLVELHKESFHLTNSRCRISIISSH